MKNIVALLCVVVAWIPYRSLAVTKTPNVIVIYADDLGMHDLGCYRDHAAPGQGPIPTPNCDRLAENAFVFTDAHSASAVCTPSRYSLLTGRYAWRTWLKCWVLQEDMPLLIDDERYTMGRMFQQAGYVTSVIGKWHLGWGHEVGEFQNGTLSPGPLECGFDHAFTVPFSHNSGKAMQVFVDGRHIVDLPRGAMPGSDEKAVRSLPDTATELSQRAVAFIEAHKDKPFFLYYPTTNVHFPVTPHKRFAGKSQRGRYGDFVVEFDWAVGQVMAALETHGLTDSTILIVTSDNGSNERQSNPFYRGRKCLIYEGGHRIPLIMSWPGHQGTSKIDTALCQTDLLPTLAALLDAELPEGAAEDGESFLPLLQGGRLLRPRKPIIHHSVTGRFAIRRGKWKVIPTTDNEAEVPWNAMHAAGKGKPIRDETGRYEDLTYNIKHATQLEWQTLGELYDLEDDPKEQHNVWEDNPEVVKELLHLLRAEREKS